MGTETGLEGPGWSGRLGGRAPQPRGRRRDAGRHRAPRRADVPLWFPGLLS